jgi:H+/gluconate symporter-like permease
MNFKLFLRTILFLAILFVMLYVGMTNTENIKFYCPLISEKPIVQPAALVYFTIFAAGVFGGTLFHMGGGKGGKSSKVKE